MANNAVVRKPAAAVVALFNPKNSEFWALLGALVGQVLCAAGYVSKDQWDHFWPVFTGYAVLRSSSKAAKA